MTTVGVAFAIIGVGGYQHRDLAADTPIQSGQVFIAPAGGRWRD
jgi:hypothetical protein